MQPNLTYPLYTPNEINVCLTKTWRDKYELSIKVLIGSGAMVKEAKRRNCKLKKTLFEFLMY